MIEPPPSFSILAKDENYNPAWRDIGRLFGIWLNGQEVDHVVIYDCNAGLVRRLQTDEAGKVQPMPERDGAAEETLHGAVTVAWYDRSDG